MHKDVNAWRAAVRAFFVVCLFLPRMALSEGEEPADLMPGVYSDPGISASQGFVGGQQQAQVDPFTGMLSIRATDLSIPGQGGLDITLTRTYHSLSPGEYPENSWIGTGWAMHYGQLRTQYLDRMCDPLLDGTVLDNPVFVTPDGVSHRLALAYSTFNVNSGGSTEQVNIGTAYISDDYGMLFCQPDGSVYYKTPTGLRYDFHDVVTTPNGPMKHVWHVSRVTDLSGNYLDISYINSGVYGGYGKLISQITASDGRVVNFTYAGANSATARLETVEYEGYIWTYEYFDGNFDFDAVEDKTYYSTGTYLVGVIDPEGLKWTYEYWPFNQTGDDGAGSIRKLINPHGGGGEYVYQKRTIPYLSVGNEHISVVEYRKIRSSAGLSFSQNGAGHWELQGSFSTDATWYYSYSSDATGDTTTIESPYDDRVYYHFGLGEATGENVWRVGTLKRLEIFNAGESGSGLPVREEIYSWDGHIISRENNQRPERTVFDHEFRVPRLLQQTIVQDGVTYTTAYQQFTSVDASFPSLPQTIIESTSGALVNGSREISKSYFFDFDTWVMGLPAAEATADGTWYANQYNPLGQLTQRSEKGAITRYTYDAEGNLASEQLGDKPATQYSQYELGVARRVTLPNGGVRTRVLDVFGRVTSETDANQKTTLHGYDDIGRKTSVTPPTGFPTSITWRPNSATITRGPYTREVNFDGFGNTTEVKVDSADSYYVSTQSLYDLNGRLLRQDLVGPYYNQSTYVVYQYDALGRMTNVSHPGGSRTIDRAAGATTVTNERGFQEVTTSMAYGNPETSFPVQIQMPDMEPILIELDNNGQMTKVSQDWIERTYEYNSDMTLYRYIEPESGIRIYSYASDGTGLLHMEFNQKLGDKDSAVAAFAKTFEYDDMGQVTTVRSTKSVINFYDPMVADGFDRKMWRKSFSYDLEGHVLESVMQTNEAVFLNSAITGDYVMMSEVPRNVRKVFSYDDVYRLAAETLHIDGRVFPLSYSYNDLGVISSLTYPDQEELTFASNGLGQITAVYPYINQVRYHINGIPKSVAYAGWGGYSTTLNARLMVDHHLIQAYNESIDYGYGYDAVGNIESISEQGGSLKTFNYDGANRLVDASGPWGIESLSYDAVGNISTRTINSVSRNYQYDSRNALRAISGGITRNYQFDEWGAAVKVNDYELDRGPDNEIVGYRYVPFVLNEHPKTTHMAYDADGRRVSLQLAGERRQYFMYASNGKLMHMLDEMTESYANYIYFNEKIVARASTVLTCGDDYDRDGISHCEEKNWGLNPFDSRDADADGDGDGLANGIEISMGLNPNNPDTDGDGMYDGFEVQYGFNPGSASDGALDADSDGYTNAQEFENGTDPLVPDPPPPATELIAIAGDGVVVLQWKSQSEAGSYRVYVSDQPIIDTAAVPFVQVQGSAYTHASAVNGTRYYFRVRTENGYGLSAPSLEATAVPNNQVWGNFSSLGSIEGSFNAQGEVSVLLPHLGDLYSRTASSAGQGGDAKISTSSSQYSSESNLRVLEHGGKHLYRESANGFKVVIWENLDNVHNVYGAYYRPDRERWYNFSINGSGTTLIQSLDINSYGDVAIGMANYQYVSGYSVAQYKPFIAKLSHVDGRLTYGDADRLNETPELSGALRERVEVSINDHGHISATWRTTDGAVWHNESTSSGVYFPQGVTRLTGLSGVNTVKRLNNGDVMVSANANYVLRVGGVWQSTVSTGESCPCYMDWSETGTVIRANTDQRRAKGKDYAAMVARIGTLINGVVEWSGAVQDIDRALPLTVAASGYGGRFYAIWQNSGTGATYQYSVWDGQSWSTAVGPNNGTGRIATAGEQIQIDAAGNIATNSGAYFNVDAAYYPVALPQAPASGVYATVTEGAGTGNEAGAVWSLPNSASFDLEDGLALQLAYTQVAGPAVQITDVSNAREFRFPEVAADTEFGFELTVTDSDGLSSTRPFSVLLQNAGNPPTISAGPDAVVDEGAVYVLDSTVPIGNYTVVWSQVSGPQGVQLSYQSSGSDGGALTVSVPQIDGNDAPLQLKQWVRDNSNGRIATDFVTLTIPSIKFEPRQ